MDKIEYAGKLMIDYHHCAQAVLCAYADEVGLPLETLKKVAAAFGGGMATTEGNCGALCGAEMVLGLMKYENKPVHKDAARLYRLFEEKCGATLCKDIKGIETKKVLCSCEDCVKHAVEALEEILQPEQE